MARYVEGVPEVVRGLEQLRDDLADLPDAYADIAQVYAADTGRAVPRRSGRLAGSVVGEAAQVNGRGEAVVTIGNSVVRYAGPINYGWARRNIRPARFTARADDQIEPRALAVLEQAIDRTIDRRGFK